MHVLLARHVDAQVPGHGGPRSRTSHRQVSLVFGLVGGGPAGAAHVGRGSAAAAAAAAAPAVWLNTCSPRRSVSSACC